MSEQPDTPVERIVRRSLIDEEGLGRPFSERVRHHPLEVERSKDHCRERPVQRVLDAYRYRSLREYRANGTKMGFQVWRATIGEPADHVIDL